MAGITSISRDWGVSPSIVRVTTDDNFATITTAGYITAQLANIVRINFGAFEFVSGDLAAIQYNGGEDFFTINLVTNTFVLDVVPPGALPLTNTHVFVGNAANVAADVAMTGDVTIANTGATTISAGAITNAKVNAGAAIAFSKLATLPSADILVGSAGGVATAVAMSGTVAISNTGATSIPLTSAQILVGSAGNVAAPVAMTGNVTISNTGVTTIANAAINPLNIGGGLITLASLAVTSAQFKAAYAAPQLVVAGLGGFSIIVHRWVLNGQFGTVQYTAGGATGLQYGNAAHLAGPLASATIPAADINAWAANSFEGALGSQPTLAVATASGAGLYLSNDAAAFATGDGDFALFIWYSYNVLL